VILWMGHADQHHPAYFPPLKAVISVGMLECVVQKQESLAAEPLLFWASFKARSCLCKQVGLVLPI
jgi:hypothetical protein